MHARSRSSHGKHASLFLAVTTALAASVLLTGCGAEAGNDDTPERRDFALRGQTLTIDSDDSALHLVPTDLDTVRVTRWFEGSVVIGDSPKVTRSMKNDRLTLRLKCSGVVADCSAKHRIEVPRDVAVKVHSSDGSVRATGFSSPLSVKTADGSVLVKDAQGALSLSSRDGSVRAEQVRSRRITASTHDGSVRLQLRAAPDLVNATSKDGSVTLTVPTTSTAAGGGKVAYRVSAHSADGGVSVSVPRDNRSPHRISARTKDGKVTVRAAN